MTALTAALAAALACSLAAPARAALDYTLFSHPKGDFKLEYPSDWRRTTGLEALLLHPPGRDGKAARITVAEEPFGKGAPATPKAYADKLAAEATGLKKVESRVPFVSGRARGERLSLVETVKLHGSYKETLPAQRQLVVIVPDGPRYLVLTLEGSGAAFERAKPEFEHLVSSLVVGPQPGRPGAKR